jgi:RNA polymerase sigma-70 factor (ECF subfamily)
MSPTDEEGILLERCLHHQPGAWNDFVDRYLGLIYRVIHFTAHQRSTSLQPEDVEDVAAEILLQIVANNYAALRQFQKRSSLATYLTVIARRICVHEMIKRHKQRTQNLGDAKQVPEPADRHQSSFDTMDEVQRLLSKLPRRAREAVRMFFLEGRSYEEISTKMNVPVNTIGALLSRAKDALRERMQARVNRKPARRKLAVKATAEAPKE